MSDKITKPKMTREETWIDLFDPKYNMDNLPYTGTYQIEVDGTFQVKECDHKWKEYIGFSNSFTFCEVCDIKFDNIKKV